MKKIKSQLVFVLVLVCCLVSMPARAAVCPPFAETIVIAANAAMKVALDMLVQKLFDAFGLQLGNFAKYKVTAVKTLTSQVATATKAKINADVALAQGEMGAIAALEQTKQQMRVFQNYSPVTGQGVDPCAQLTAQTNLTLADGQAVSLASEMLSDVAAVPGRYGSSEQFTDRVLQQRGLMFATEDEAKLGYGVAATTVVQSATGEPISMAGADTNARILFIDSDHPQVKQARTAYLNYMAGQPDQAITGDVAKLPSGREYLALKKRKDAFMSVGLNSLSMVGADHTPNGEIGGRSKMGAMRDMVGQYFGATAMPRWQGWTSQSERGLMVDKLKLSAAHLALDAKLLEQSLRREALLSTVLALEAAQEQDGVGAASQALERERSRTSVR